jgi:hypothetical protein
LMLADVNGPWPEWVFPLQAAAQSDGSMSGVVLGGTTK